MMEPHRQTLLPNVGPDTYFRSHRRLHADDVVHQSFGDRLLHGRHSELALGVLGMKDHRSPADAYNFRGIQSALSASCPLQAGPLALSEAGANRRRGYIAQLRMQVDRNEM